MEVKVDEAKAHLSKLPERVAVGVEVILPRAGMPVANVVASPRKQRASFVPDDFNHPLPKEMEDLFYL